MYQSHKQLECLPLLSKCPPFSIFGLIGKQDMLKTSTSILYSIKQKSSKKRNHNKWMEILKICSIHYQDDTPLTPSLGPTSTTDMATNQHILSCWAKCSFRTFLPEHSRKPLWISQGHPMSRTLFAMSREIRRARVSQARVSKPGSDGQPIYL